MKHRYSDVVTALRPQSRADRDGGVAMLMALFVMLMVSTLSIGILAVTLNEAHPSLVQKKLTRSINAAQGGLQAVLNQLRAANDGTGDNIGVLGALPCSLKGATFNVSGTAVHVDGATVSGSIANTDGNPAYAASVAYYLQDPSNFTAAELSAKAMSCGSGHLSTIPAYAFVQSVGRGTAVAGLAATTGDRSVHGTYQFSTSNVNTAGGRILEFGTTLCMEAANNPSVGSQVTMQPCQPLGYAPQLWSYRTDLTILYEGNPALNLCIQAAPTSGTIATLQACTSPAGTTQSKTYPYLSGTQEQQEWAFNDNGHFATAADNGSVGGTCLQPQNASDGTAATAGAVLVVTTCGGATQGYTAWNPDPQVGAGKAGTVTTGIPDSPTYQFVNYQEFGRCLDITGQQVGADHLIAYPCKQAPDPGQLTFNQVWKFTGSAGGGSGTLSVLCPSGRGDCTGGVRYCLTAPPDGNSTTYPTVSPCTGISSQNWKATGEIQGNYASSYELLSATSGKCLTADSSVVKTAGSSTITVAGCDGSAKQKWNAPPNAVDNNLSNLQEDQGAR